MNNELNDDQQPPVDPGRMMLIEGKAVACPEGYEPLFDAAEKVKAGDLIFNITRGWLSLDLAQELFDGLTVIVFGEEVGFFYGVCRPVPYPIAV